MAADLQSYLLIARNIIRLFKQVGVTEDAIDDLFEELSLTEYARQNLLIHNLILFSIQFPLLVLLLLEAGVYLTTFADLEDNEVFISQNIKDLFVKKNLENKSDPLFDTPNAVFSKNPSMNTDNYNINIVSAAQFMYNSFVLSWHGEPPNVVKQQLSIIEKLLVQLYEIPELGTRALESAEISAWTTSALQLVTYVGCKEGIFQGADSIAKCGAMQALYDNLLRRSLNPNL